jgi:hypothetical protein
MEPFAPWEF